jgi:hypothetical protein
MAKEGYGPRVIQYFRDNVVGLRNSIYLVLMSFRAIYRDAKAMLYILIKDFQAWVAKPIVLYSYLYS